MVYASGGINRRISLATKETTVNTEQTDLTEKTTSGKKGLHAQDCCQEERVLKDRYEDVAQDGREEDLRRQEKQESGRRREPDRAGRS